MRNVYLLSLFFAGSVACDGVDDTAAEDAEVRSDELEGQVHEPKPRTQDEEGDPDDGRNWSELDLTNANGVKGPPGKTCCANCGDYWPGWYNLGTADDGNHRANEYCSWKGWTLINAEWRTPYDGFQCY